MTPSTQVISYNDFTKQAAWLGQQLLVALWSERLRWSGLEIIEDEFMTRTRSPNPHQELHNVLATRIRQSSLSQDIDRCLAILASEAQASRWFLNTQNQESEIIEQLLARGFDDFASISVMAYDLQSFDRLAKPPTAFEQRAVRKLSDEKHLKQWVEVLASTHDCPNDFANTWLDMLLSCGFDEQLPWRYYAYFDNGRPVGVLSALWTEQVATIEILHVKKGYRGNGIGSALLYHALKEAKVAGYEVTVSGPLAATKPTYERFGFRTMGAIDCVTIDIERAERYIGSASSVVNSQTKSTTPPPRIYAGYSTLEE